MAEGGPKAQRHRLVEGCEDEQEQHRRLLDIQAELAEIEIQRGAQTREGEKLDTRHLDMLYWKVLHSYKGWNGLGEAGAGGAGQLSARSAASASARSVGRSGTSVRSVRSVQNARRGTA